MASRFNGGCRWPIDLEPSAMEERGHAGCVLLSLPGLGSFLALVPQGCTPGLLSFALRAGLVRRRISAGFWIFASTGGRREPSSYGEMTSLQRHRESQEAVGGSQ
jgi:hypothetical protein